VPLITFAIAPNPTEAQIMAVIESVIGAGRPGVSLGYNFDLGVIFSVDLPDATQIEADAVQAALVAAFPSQTAGVQAEPHALLSIPNAGIWTNMPAALTEFLGSPNWRAGCSMKKVEQVRLVVNVLTVGQAGALLAARWSTGGAFAFFDTVASGPQVTIATAGFRVSPWTNVPIAARMDGVAIQVIGQGGNAVLDPAFGQVLIEGR
jgi:hypothetical protein